MEGGREGDGGSEMEGRREMEGDGGGGRETNGGGRERVSWICQWSCRHVVIDMESVDHV